MLHVARCIMRVEGRDFVADLVLSYQTVVAAEPRLAFAIGWRWRDAMCHVIARGGTFRPVSQRSSRRRLTRRWRPHWDVAPTSDEIASNLRTKPDRIWRPRWWRGHSLYPWLGDACLWGLFPGWSGLQIRITVDNDRRADDECLGDNPPNRHPDGK